MEKLKSIYVDCANWAHYIQPDDFIVAVGKTKSNSVYHVVEAKCKPRDQSRIVRWYLKVLPTDLLTAIRRDPDQQIITITWYPRNKK